MWSSALGVSLVILATEEGTQDRFVVGKSAGHSEREASRYSLLHCLEDKGK